MGAVLIIIAIPFKLIGFLFKHPRLLVLAAVIVFGFVGVRACSSALGGGSKSSTALAAVELPAYVKIAPDAKVAPYLLTTNTRVYYASRFTITKKYDSVTLVGYWSYDSKEWKWQAGSLTIAKKQYPGARLYDRANNSLLVSF